MNRIVDPLVNQFLAGKSQHTLDLFHHFIAEFESVGEIMLHPAKTMIGIGNGKKRVVYVNQLGKDFLHAVFIFKEPHEDNFCFQKIAQVPEMKQFNHHFRMLQLEDVNDEVKRFMKLAMEGTND